MCLVLGDKWRKEQEQQNVEEASEDEDPDSSNKRTTKQLIKQGIEDLYEDHILHEEEVQEQKTNDEEKEEKGKLAASRIKEAVLGQLQQHQSTRNVESQQQTRRKALKNPLRTKDKSRSSSSVNSPEGNGSSVDNDDKEYIEVNEDSPDDTPQHCRDTKIELIFGPTSSKSSSTSKHKNIGSVDSVVVELMQQNAYRQEKLLEMQKQCLQYKTMKGGQEEESRVEQGKRNWSETTMT